MSRTRATLTPVTPATPSPSPVPRPSPLLLYGLDVPFTSFAAVHHNNYQFTDVTKKNNVSMMFFDKPVYMQTHAVVRIPKDKYGKTAFSVYEDESKFIRVVENDVVAHLDRLVMIAEPSIQAASLPLKSVTYENLVKLRARKCVGMTLMGSLVEDHDATLTKGVMALVTIEVYGVYYSQSGKGVLTRIQSYRIVESF